MSSVSEDSDTVTTEAHGLLRNRNCEKKSIATAKGANQEKSKSTFFGLWSSKSSGTHSETAKGEGEAAGSTIFEEKEVTNPLKGTWTI